MLGVLLTVVFSVVAAFAGMFLVSRWKSELDPAEKVGLGGLVGLGVAGLLTLLVGLLPGGLEFALYVVAGLMLVLAVMGLKSGAWKLLQIAKPQGVELVAVAALVIIGLLALVAVLAPSISSDWDTIAYHLAVPKLWLEHGQIDYIQGIHHSNFPSTMEMLFMWGLQWGGQSGAKAFSLVVYLFGCLSLFGLARRWYGRSAGWWAAIAFAGIPVVAWESGTGYIDVAHGLYCALGAAYAVDHFRNTNRSSLVLAGVCLGFAMGTKYTGLQMLFSTIVVVGTAALVVNARNGGQWFKEVARAKLTIFLLAVVIAAPWYVKTAVMTGNPVYPFFYSVLGGKDWDEWRSEIYTNEQKSFGVGSSPASAGHAILGLAYQPGRYTNPAPAQGQGFPTGAIGFACLLGGVAAAMSGRLRREERLLLAIVGLQFLLWFALSQQSRYLTMLAIPLGLVAAGQVSRTKWGTVVAATIGVQALYTGYMLNATQTQMQLQVVGGKVSQDRYLTELMSPFYPASKAMNELPSGSRVALYDEVFGFYLDVPYFWANPGHSMLIPYEGMESAEDYASAMRELGFTHIYVNLIGQDEQYVKALTGEQPYPPDARAALFPDLNHRWKILLSDARRAGYVEVEKTWRGAVLFRVVR